MSALCRSRSTVAVATVLGTSSSKQGIVGQHKRRSLPMMSRNADFATLRDPVDYSSRFAAKKQTVKLQTVAVVESSDRPVEHFVGDEGALAPEPLANRTPRPDSVRTVRDLAALYVDLLDELDLENVTIVGNSIGGWIAAEVAALDSPRISSVVIVDGVGLAVADHPYVDFFSLTPAQVAEHSYADPATCGVDPAALPPEVRAIILGNREPLALYGGQKMADPALAERLANVTAPTLLVWGEADRISEPAVGEAYAAAIPGARFHLIQHAGHLPQIERPAELVDVVWDFANQHRHNQPASRSKVSSGIEGPVVSDGVQCAE